MDNIWPAIQTLIPSVGLLLLFYFVMRHIMEGDRRERIAQRQFEEAHDLSRGAVGPTDDEARLQNAHLPKSAPGTMDSRSDNPQE